MLLNADQSVLNQLIEGCQLIGPDFRYLFVNDAVVAQAKRTREELIGRYMWDAFPGIERTPMFATLERCMRQRVPAVFDNEFAFPTGERAWFALRMEPVEQGLFILSVDISSRKEIELQLENRIRRLQALRAIDLAIIGAPDPQNALQTVVDRAVATLDADAALVLLLGRDGQTLEYFAGTGFETHTVELTRQRVGEGTAGRIAAARSGAVVDELRVGDETFDGWLLIRAERFRATAVAPLLVGERLLGVLQLFSRSRFPPGEQWLEFFHALAGQACIALESGRMIHELAQANEQLRFAYDRTIEGWSRALDLRDHDTVGHTLRVTELTVALARMAGMSDDELDHVRRGALLHDIGKMAVPDRILHKRGPLDAQEWSVMREHPSNAYELLSPIEYLRPALSIPLCHHERWDGSGYPNGLRGEAIPLAARLFAVADVWDALRSDRPYRAAWPEDRALEHIRAGSGSHFDPGAVDLFERHLRQGLHPE